MVHVYVYVKRRLDAQLHVDISYASNAKKRLKLSHMNDHVLCADQILIYAEAVMKDFCTMECLVATLRVNPNCLDNMPRRGCLLRPKLNVTVKPLYRYRG